MELIFLVLTNLLKNACLCFNEDIQERVKKDEEMKFEAERL